VNIANFNDFFIKLAHIESEAGRCGQQLKILNDLVLATTKVTSDLKDKLCSCAMQAWHMNGWMTDILYEAEDLYPGFQQFIVANVKFFYSHVFYK